MKPFREKFRLLPRGLVMQLFATIILPLTVILVAVTFGSIAIHQNAMRQLVAQRDELMVNIVTAAINAQIELRLKELSGLQLLISSDTAEPISSRLSATGFLSDDFNRGLAVVDLEGKFLATTGNDDIWKAWAAGQTGWKAVFLKLVTNPGILNVYQSPGDTAFTGLIAAPEGRNLIVLGGFSITNLVENALGNVLPASNQFSIFLVDTNHQVLYTSGETASISARHPGINEALQGQSGIVYVKEHGDEHVTAYSPITTGWALITEEVWETVVTPTLQTSQIAPLALVPALVIMSVALWLGAQQVVRPLHQLEAKAATLAAGDFTSIQEPVGGIAEIQHLQDELVVMGRKVQEAQRSLHGYIGAITAAQEEERRRLARELHDDTLQTLIALKQRIQLARSEPQMIHPDTTSGLADIHETGVLIEQTIENLRRLTRDLRPIYLEDLGLVPALEMLSRETGQAMGIMVNFQRQGAEIRLDSPIELTLYRIAQEALSNISRHAHAEQVSVVLSFWPDVVRLTISDNGIGFTLPENLSTYATQGHYGLLGLSERVQLIGAALKIDSSPGKGTAVSVTLPAQLSQKR